MAFPKLIPGTLAPVPSKKKDQNVRQPVQAYQSAGIDRYGSGGARTSGGGGGTVARRSGGTTSGYQAAVNPWDAAMKANYAAAQARPYAAEWGQGVAQAMKLGNRDYEGDLRRFAQEDVQRQITAADNQLGSIGMRELALKGDVQADRAKAQADASTRAMIESQGIKANALETMRGMLGSATGAELDRIGQMIQAASAGGSNYNEFSALAIPLQEKLGAGTGATGVGGATYTSEARPYNYALSAWQRSHPGMNYELWMRQNAARK